MNDSLTIFHDVRGIASNATSNGMTNFSSYGTISTEVNKHFAELEEDSAIDVDRELDFKYKDHWCTGKPIHIVALHNEGESIFDELVKRRANIDEECSYYKEGHEKTMKIKLKPIHLAAGMGNVPVMEKLLDQGANIREKATIDGDVYYEPIHDAAFLGQTRSVELLLQKGVDPNEGNMSGFTPLHFAADQGHHKLAILVLKHNADIDRKDVSKPTPLTPLQVALRGDKWPDDQLHLLCNKKMDDFMQVAKVSQAAAILLAKEWAKEIKRADPHPSSQIRDLGRDPTDQRMRQSIDIKPRQWMDLALSAPKVAEEMMHTTLVHPTTENPRRHPLPKNACLLEPMRTEYRTDKEWKYTDMISFKAEESWHAKLFGKRANTDKYNTDKYYPEWHDILVPPKNYLKAGGSVEIRVRRVDIPDVICAEMLFALVEGNHPPMFTKVAIQAIITHVWTSLAQYYYFMVLIYRVLLLGNLCQAAFMRFPLNWFFARRVSWSLGITVASLEFFNQVSEINGYCFTLQKPMKYFFSRSNCWDICGNGLSLYLWISISVESPDSLDLYSNPRVFALVAFYYWLRTINTLSASPRFGKQILPILYSFNALIPMLIVTALLFVSFFHVCTILENNSSDDSWHDKWFLFIQTFRLLFTSDGDGMQHVLELGDHGESGDLTTYVVLIVAVMGFCICMLNLFIAVHSESYDIAQEFANPSFARERASICLKVLLLPYWPGSYIQNWPAVVIALLSSTVTINLYLLYSGFKLLPWAILICGLLLSQALWLHRPWRVRNTWGGLLQRMLRRSGSVTTNEEQSSSGHYLWVCYRKDWMKLDYWPDSMDDSSGRIAKLKRDFERIGQELDGQTKHMHRLEQKMNDGFDEIKNAINAISSNVSAKATTHKTHFPSSLVHAITSAQDAHASSTSSIRQPLKLSLSHSVACKGKDGDGIVAFG